MLGTLRLLRVPGLRGPALFGLLASLCLPVQLFAEPPAKHYHYKLIDLGTFGGLQSYTAGTAVLVTGLELNNSGVLVGFADTAISDPTPLPLFQLGLPRLLRIRMARRRDERPRFTAPRLE